MEERPYAPSELKLTRLRFAGVVPVSKDLTSFSVCLGALVGLSLSLRHIQKVLPQMLQGTANEVSSAFLWKSLSLVLTSSALFIIPLLFVVAVIGGFQTRFLLSFGLVRLSVGRLFRWWENLSGGISRRALLGVLALGKALGWCWLVYALGGALISTFVAASPGLLAELERGEQAVRSITLAAVGYLFFFGVLSRFIVVLVFRADHRMSRGELESEYRETEPSSEVKQARRSFWDNESEREK